MMTPKNRFLVTLFYLSIATLVNSSFFNPKAQIGIKINYVRTCPTHKDTKQILSYTRFKYNRTTFVANVTWDVLEPFDRSYKIRLSVRKWGDGGWKNNFYNLEKSDACNSLKILIGNEWNQALRKAGINPKCPIKPGHYVLHNFKVDDDVRIDSPLVASPGKFHIVYQIIKNKKVAICFDFEDEIFEEHKYE